MVWEDHAYGLIAWKQETHFGRHTELSFGNPEWTGLAKAFGWHGRYVDKSVDLQDALNEGFATPGPSLIVLPIDYRENLLLTQKLGELTCPD
jgi:acetolactate synthase-1/2/3 large subunit